MLREVMLIVLRFFTLVLLLMFTYVFSPWAKFRDYLRGIEGGCVASERSSGFPLMFCTSFPNAFRRGFRAV